MSMQTASFGLGLHSLRTLLHTPQVAHASARGAAAPAPSWLERLAAWADRQPMHHHVGSCRWL
ncbi:MAG: hypothetical protein Q7U73_00485 [Rubrivivax sp.]|nr:hypothetical protein [Rubrivivax sp.]